MTPMAIFNAYSIQLPRDTQNRIEYHLIGHTLSSSNVIAYSQYLVRKAMSSNPAALIVLSIKLTSST